MRAPLALVMRETARRSALRTGLALVYHRVGDPAGDYRTDLVPALGTDLFRRQLEHLHDHYRVVPAAGLLEAAATRRRGDPFPVAITFDDDLPSNVGVAATALRATGLPATFFLCGASLEAPFAFWWERLQRAMDRLPADPEPLAAVPAAAGRARPEAVWEIADAVRDMSPTERDNVSSELLERLGPDPVDSGMRAGAVGRLAGDGFDIGFHTRRHDPLPSLDDPALQRAMHDGRSELEVLAGARLDSIAYPHGAVDARVVRAARQAGFTTGFTTEEAAVRPGQDPLLQGRIEPDFTSLDRFGLRVVRVLTGR